MRSAILLASISVAGALVLPTRAPQRTPQRARTVQLKITDDEGNSVQDIVSGTSFADYVAGLGDTPTLAPEKAEKLVLPEPSWKVSKMAVSDIDEEIELSCASMDFAEVPIDVDPMMKYASTARNPGWR